MNTLAKKNWVYSLRHGRWDHPTNKMLDKRYYPTTDTLRWADKFCALGVLCDHAVIAGKGEWRGDKFYYHETNTLHMMFLPPKMAEKLGVTMTVDLPFHARHSDDPDREANSFYSVQQANDDGLPWDQIADLIDHLL